jgi:hypothetical protein
MKIAILGTGTVGTALGERLAQPGHEVSFGSRNPAEHPGAVSQREAVESAEVVVTAIPGAAVLSTLESIGEEALGGRIVLDPSVAITPEMALAYPNDSLARQIQERFPRTRVVKTLNTMNVSVMIDPLTTLPQATVYLSGDDADAKATVTTLLADLGWPSQNVLDLGAIATAVGTEHLAPLFFATYMALQTPAFNIAIIR